MKEILGEIIKKCINSIWFKVILVVLIILMSGVLYITIKTPNVKKGTVLDDNRIQSIQKKINDFYSIESKGIPKETEAPNKVNKRNGAVEEVILKYFSFAKLNEIELFPSVVSYGRFQSDFFKFEFDQRDAEMVKAFNKITRNHQLRSVKVIRTLWVMKANSTRVVVDLHYKDRKKPFRVNLLIKKIKQSDGHSKGKETDMYFVDTSIWELIESIEHKEGN